MTRWFRFYDDAINEPKLLKLSDALFRAWVGLLCIASKNAGRFPPADDCALMLRMKPERTEAVLADLARAGLVDEDETGKFPHNWNTRQFKSDVSNERVGRYRERQRNVTPTVTVTPSESDTESDTEQNRVSEEQGANKNLPDPAKAEIALALDAWNELAGRFPRMPRVQRLTDTRRAALAARLRESGGIVGWQAALEKIAANPWLTGDKPSKSNPNWRCTFDFLVSQRGFTRVMEGNYDDHTADDAQSARSRENAAILEGVGLGPDQQRGADTGGEGPVVALGDLGSDAATFTDDTGDPGRGNPQAGRLGQGIQRAGGRPENRRRGVSRGTGLATPRSALGSVQSDQGGAQVGDETPLAERDHGDGERPTGGASPAAAEAQSGEVLPGGNGTRPTDSGGAPACERDHGPVADQAGYDRDRELISTLDGMARLRA